LRRLEHVRTRAARHRQAHRSQGKRRHQRDLAGRPRSLQLRGCLLGRPPAHATRPRGRRMARYPLGGGAGTRRHAIARCRERPDRDARLTTRDARGGVSAESDCGAPRHGEHRPSHRAARFLRSGQRSTDPLARLRYRGSRDERCDLRHRLEHPRRSADHRPPAPQGRTRGRQDQLREQRAVRVLLRRRSLPVGRRTCRTAVRRRRQGRDRVPEAGRRRARPAGKHRRPAPGVRRRALARGRDRGCGRRAARHAVARPEQRRGDYRRTVAASGRRRQATHHAGSARRCDARRSARCGPAARPGTRCRPAGDRRPRGQTETAGLCHRAHAVRVGRVARVRRPVASRRHLRGDVRHLRQRRRYLAEFWRHRQPRRGVPAGVEGPAGHRQSRGDAGLRLRDVRGRARRVCGARGRREVRCPEPRLLGQEGARRQGRPGR